MNYCHTCMGTVEQPIDCAQCGGRFCGAHLLKHPNCIGGNAVRGRFHDEQEGLRYRCSACGRDLDAKEVFSHYGELAHEVLEEDGMPAPCGQVFAVRES